MRAAFAFPSSQVAFLPNTITHHAGSVFQRLPLLIHLLIPCYLASIPYSEGENGISILYQCQYFSFPWKEETARTSLAACIIKDPSSPRTWGLLFIRLWLIFNSYLSRFFLCNSNSTFHLFLPKDSNMKGLLFMHLWLIFNSNSIIFFHQKNLTWGDSLYIFLIDF